MKRYDYAQAVILGLIAGFCVRNTYQSSVMITAAVTIAAVIAVCVVRRMDAQEDGTEHYRRNVEARLSDAVERLEVQKRSLEELMDSMKVALADMEDERCRREDQRYEAVSDTMKELVNTVSGTVEALETGASRLEKAAEAQRQFMEEISGRSLDSIRLYLDDHVCQRFDALQDLLTRKLTDLKETASAAKEIRDLCENSLNDLTDGQAEIKSSLTQMTRGLDNSVNVEKDLINQYRELQNSYIKEMVKLGEQSKDIVRLMNDSYKCLNLAAKSQ